MRDSDEVARVDLKHLYLCHPPQSRFNYKASIWPCLRVKTLRHKPYLPKNIWKPDYKWDSNPQMGFELCRNKYEPIMPWSYDTLMQSALLINRCARLKKRRSGIRLPGWSKCQQICIAVIFFVWKAEKFRLRVFDDFISLQFSFDYQFYIVPQQYIFYIAQYYSYIVLTYAIFSVAMETVTTPTRTHVTFRSSIAKVFALMSPFLAFSRRHWRQQSNISFNVKRISNTSK